MLNKFFGFFILSLFSLFSISYIVFPIFLIAELLTFSFRLTFLNLQNTILMALFCGSILIIISVLKNILFFYVSFFIRRKTKKFIDYNSTQYSKMMNILQHESFNKINFAPMKIKILLDEDFKPNVYSFGSRNRGFIIFSIGMVDHIVKLVKENPNNALQSFQSLVAHEISHLKNYDFINFDFYNAQLKLSSFLISIYKNILKILKFIFTILPIPIVRKWVQSFFDFILIKPIIFILSIPLFLFQKVNNLLRHTLFQINETVADSTAIKIFDMKDFELYLSHIPNYSTKLSLHKKTPEQRLSKVAKIKKEDFTFDDDCKDIFILANSLVLLMMGLCLMMSLFLINLDELILIKNFFINDVMQLENSQLNFGQIITNAKNLFFNIS